MCPISTNEQPTGKPLFEFVLCVAARRLNRLDKLRLNVSQCHFLKRSAESKLFSGNIYFARITVASNLRVDAIKAFLRSHQRGDANDRLITKHANFYLRSILKSCSHRGHPLLDENKMFDGTSGKLDFMHQLEYNQTQLETRDYFRS